jgi:hypothetical protein
MAAVKRTQGNLDDPFGAARPKFRLFLPAEQGRRSATSFVGRRESASVKNFPNPRRTPSRLSHWLRANAEASGSIKEKLGGARLGHQMVVRKLFQTRFQPAGQRVKSRNSRAIQSPCRSR